MYFAKEMFGIFLYYFYKLSRLGFLHFSRFMHNGTVLYEMYHQQENKWYPQGFLLPISKLHFILAAQNLLAHNNITIDYYVKVNFLRL